MSLRSRNLDVRHPRGYGAIAICKSWNRNDSMGGGDRMIKVPGNAPKKFDTVPFEKHFYVQHCLLDQRALCDVRLFRDANQILVDDEVEKPIQNFNEVHLPEYIREEISRQGYKLPTPIQAQSWPIVLSGQNLVGIAQTGSGKTLGYILPAIIHIRNQPSLQRNDGPIALILAPTRELAQQIHEVARNFGFPASVKSACVFGGVSKTEQWRAMKGSAIVIATPGRLIDFLEGGDVSLRRCTYLVLDEADRMLDMGFEPQIRKIISEIRPDRQILMWSATWPVAVKRLAEEFLGKYIKIKIGSTELCASHNIRQIVQVCEERDKEKKLKILLNDLYEKSNHPGKILIFAATKRRVDKVAWMLNVSRFRCRALHGDKPQTVRDSILLDFRSGKCNILVASDVAARGLDVGGIKYVINFDYPQTSEDYVHRIGRTGRSSTSGTAYTLVTAKDSKRVENLISVLEEANQPISSALRQLATENQCCGGSFGNRGRQDRMGFNNRGHGGGYNRRYIN